MTDMEYKILEGSYTTVDRVIGEFSACPNMRLSGQDDDWTKKSVSALNKAHWGDDAKVIGMPKGESGKLDELFGPLTGVMRQSDTLTIHWLACSTLALNQVGGRSHGLNAADFQHRAAQGRFRIANKDGSFSWI
ncbi:MAG: hypothetical protein JJT81_09260 [Rubellimicrobium sp.]|nr:hypothetical protein [Rubellimicrobium sp.]